jgi:hypothetical protein
MDTWMTKEELFEGMMHWQKLAMLRWANIKELEDYIDELEFTINMINAEDLKKNEV